MKKEEKDVEVKGLIHTTTNYELFKFLDSNREISEKNKKKIVQSLQRKDVYGASTILVKKHDDGYYYIYEGQHRFASKVELNLPIDFIINQDLELDDVSLMNTASQEWMLKDFLRQYLSDEVETENKKSYERFQFLLNEYGNDTNDESVRAITFTEILYITTGYGGNTINHFKTGKLNISDDNFERAKRICDTLKDFLKVDETLPVNINFRKYMRALIDIIEKTEGWAISDTKILTNKVKTYRGDLDYKNYSVEEPYKSILFSLYNKGQKKRYMETKTIKGGKENIYYMSEY